MSRENKTIKIYERRPLAKTKSISSSSRFKQHSQRGAISGFFFVNSSIRVLITCSRIPKRNCFVRLFLTPRKNVWNYCTFSCLTARSEVSGLRQISVSLVYRDTPDLPLDKFWRQLFHFASFLQPSLPDGTQLRTRKYRSHHRHHHGQVKCGKGSECSSMSSSVSECAICLEEFSDGQVG